jgi:hydrophobic/amphiphilic exporter-1 (mainly G- bacteria), HAE1 family
MSEFFIRRPIVAMVISIFTIILGLLTLKGVPISQYPDITPPMIKITGSYSGANAINVEQAVATPIEQQVNGVENMLYMQSINANDGSTTIQVSFDVGTNLDNANMLTQNRVAQANPSLPPSVKNQGINTKKALAFPMMIVSLYSPNNTYDANFVSNYAYINVVDQIKRLKGVGDVTVFGGAQYAMRIWLNPNKMNTLGISVDDVRNALDIYNNIYPGGSFGNSPAIPGIQNTYTAQLQSRLITVEAFSNIVIKGSSSGAIVKLSDVSRVELGTQNYSQTCRFNGRNASAIAIYQVPGSNALALAANVRKTMVQLSQNFPDDLNFTYSLDTTLAVSAGIDEIIHTLIEALVLVILVVFIFLQEWRATVIPLMTVPVSLIGTFMFFPLLGFSVNVLSLLGMVLAIGLVVDDAIVVVEAVMHHIEEGLTPKEATSKAMKEVAGPVVAIAIVLSAVFIPVALTAGITGRLYQQFAITIAVSVCLSAFNALTLTPALAAMLLKPKQEDRKKNLLDRFFDGFNKRFDRFTTGYTRLAGFFARKLIVTLIALGIIAVTAGSLLKKVPGGFVPEEDEGYFLMAGLLPDAASAERTDSVTHRMENILGKIPEIQSYTVINGYSVLSSTNSNNSATIFVQLTGWHDRKKTAAEVIREVNQVCAIGITEGTAIAVSPPPIPGLGNAAGFTVEVQDRTGHSPMYLAEQAQNFILAARKHPEIGTIYTLFRATVPQKSITVDKDKVEKLGLNLNTVNGTISTLLGSAFVNNFNEFGRQYQTYIMADAPFRMTPNDLGQFTVKDLSGNMVSLATLATVTDTIGPLYTTRFDLYRSAEISGSPAEGYTSAQALNVLGEVAKESLPKEMGFAYSNMSYQEKAAEGQGGIVFVMALIFVFFILAAQYESWSLPFSVLLGTPWAIMGAMGGLFLGRLFSDTYVNNVFAQIGLVMLIGLNAKNAILIVEFAKMRLEEGATVMEAAIDGAKLRFRPILMTSFAFILGVVPLVRASGAGSQSRKVMGMAVFSGMITATVLGTILIPAFFVLIERNKKKKAKNAVVNSSDSTQSVS